MSKEYSIREISKNEASELLLRYHYLKDISKGFKSGVNIGLFTPEGGLVGAAIFTGFPVPELAVGMFGLGRDEQFGLYELSRFCLFPDEQRREHNLASYFLAKSIKFLRKKATVRAILSYADSEFHSGVLYAASNFIYCGLTAAKKDYYVKDLASGGFIKHSRGPIQGLEGEWRSRSRKHRFVKVFDKKLRLRWTIQKWGNHETHR